MPTFDDIGAAAFELHQIKARMNRKFGRYSVTQTCQNDRELWAEYVDARDYLKGLLLAKERSEALIKAVRESMKKK